MTIVDLSAVMAATRNRTQIEAHIRSLDQQILDALLRIEELLAARFAPVPPLAPIDMTETKAEPKATPKKIAGRK
jgi:hypothetical protein